MKKFMKGCAWTALFLLVIGIVMLVAGKKFADVQDISSVVDEVSNGTVQVNLDSLSNFGITFGDNIGDSLGGIEINYNLSDDIDFNNDYEILKGDVQKYCPGEGVEKLNVEMGGGTLVTAPTQFDNYYIEVKNAEKFQGYVEGNTLYIKGSVSGNNTRIEELNEFTVVLYVPENAHLKQATVAIGAGKVVMEGMKIDTAIFDVGAGYCAMKDVQSEELSFSVGAGKIEITDMATGQFHAEVGMGECVASGVITGDVDAECAMGNMELKIRGREEDFNYNLESAMGNIDLGEKSFSGFAEEQTIQNNAEKNMSVECAMGNITIQFTE